MSEPKLLTFNAWSRKRIKEGRKFCTSRKRCHANDPNVAAINWKSWKWIKENLYRVEGADSPEELQRIMNQCQRRKVADYEMFYVHFGDFQEKEATDE